MATKRKSHAANIKKSVRLQKTLAVICDCADHTGAEIQRRTKSMAVHTNIHELRQNGYLISCRRVAGKDDCYVSIYRLLKKNPVK